MPDSPLAQALASASDTRAIEAGLDVLDRCGEVFTRTFGKVTALPVADENTWNVAGQPVVDSLRQAGVEVSDPLLFPASPAPYASYDYVERVRDFLQQHQGAAVVIGSGTLNDLTKLASGELEREYMVVGTAASMDGYASYGAPISIDGFKITRYCPAPAAVVADYRVMAAAPTRLTATGVGDLIEKIPAGADWILADELDVEPIEDSVWNLVQGPLRASLADPQALVAGELEATGRLGEGLLMSGLAMQAHRSSRPASGAGHQFSHLWEMEGLGQDWDPPLSHGMKVGLGTIAMCALYEVVLRRGLDGVDVDAAVAAWPTWDQMVQRIRSARLPEQVTTAALEQSRAKYVEPEQLRERLENARQRWPQIAGRVREQLLPAAEVEHTLQVMGAVSHPSQIGVNEAAFRAMYSRAQMIRKRYTLLDLLLEAGLLEDCVAELFAPGGFWAQRPW